MLVRLTLLFCLMTLNAQAQVEDLNLGDLDDLSILEEELGEEPSDEDLLDEEEANDASAKGILINKKQF